MSNEPDEYVQLPFVSRFLTNYERIQRLQVHIVDTVRTDPSLQPQPKPIPLDHIIWEIFRAVCVMSHAMLEDALRGIGEIYLPNASYEVLKTIPLAGSSASVRVDKFTLGEVSKFRKQTGDDIIKESVKFYLSKTSFNNVGDIKRFLKKIKIDSTPFNPLFPDLTKLMLRRHLIVHKADLSDETHLPTSFQDGGFSKFISSFTASPNFIWQLLEAEWERLHEIYENMPIFPPVQQFHDTYQLLQKVVKAL